MADQEQSYKVISVLGDSIANGYFDDEHLGWVSRLIQKLHRQQPNGFYVRNFAVSGDRVCNCLERLRSQVVDNPGDALIIACGVNDLARWGDKNRQTDLSLSFRIQKWVSLLTEARRIHKNTYVIQILPVDETRIPARQNDEGEDHYYRNDDIRGYNEVIKGLCERFSCRYINLEDMLRTKNWNDYLFDDVHPNADGHALIADAVYNHIKGDLL